MKHRIHVNQRKIASNAKHGRNDAVISIKTYKSNVYAHEAIILDEQGREIARVVYRPHKPLGCGARVWIETDYNVQAIHNVETEV